MVKLLADQLPAGGRFVPYQDPSANDNHAESVGAFLRYDDGHGVAALQVFLHRDPRPFPSGSPASSPAFLGFTCDTQARRHSGPPPGPISCQNRFLPDGSWEMVAANDGIVPGLYGHHVTIWRPDGDILVLHAYSGTINAYGHKEAATRDRPPVTLEQWQAIAENPEWQLRIPQSLADGGARLTATIPHAPFPQG